MPSDSPPRKSGFGAAQAVLALATAILAVAWFVPLRPSDLIVSYTSEGTVVRSADGTQHSVLAGDTVSEGDQVVVPAGGAVTLSSPDGHNVSLSDSTEIEIIEAQSTLLGGKVKAQINVTNGAARVSGTGKARSSLEIGLPNGLAGVRGTDFGVRVAGSQTLISVHEGSIEVADVTGASVPLGAGEGVVLTETGSTVATLPVAPTLLAPDPGAVIDSLGSQVTWSAVQDATTYVIEIALDAGFLELLRTFEVSGTSAEIPVLTQDQSVYLRVSGRNAAGLTGAPSAPLQVDNRLRLAQGLQFQAGGDLLGSIEEFEAAIANFQDDVVLLRDLGWAFYLASRYAESRPRYERAVELDPDDVATRLELARVYFFLEEYDLAEGLYQGVLADDPEDADALWGWSDVLRVTGRTDEAIQRAREALRLQPDHPYAGGTLRQLTGRE